MKMGWTTWNDRLSLFLLGSIIGLWIVNHWYAMPAEVIGATIVVFTMVAQFYFRKAPDTTATTEKK